MAPGTKAAAPVAAVASKKPFFFIIGDPFPVPIPKIRLQFVSRPSSTDKKGPANFSAFEPAISKFAGARSIFATPKSLEFIAKIRGIRLPAYDRAHF